MIWDIKEYELNKMYNEAQLFYQKNKHLKVSKSIEGPNKKLGIWLEEQRRNYRKDNHYNDELIKKLESINMVWNPYKSPILIWEEWFIKAKDFYNKNLQERMYKDILMGNTGIGIHRDDMKIYINGAESKSFASQGQQRCCALA